MENKIEATGKKQIVEGKTSLLSEMHCEKAIDLTVSSSLALAFLGDSVYELLVREYLLAQGLTRVNQLHKETVKFVNAHTQSAVLHAIEDRLTPDETDIVRRGRNAKSRIPKNVEMIEYHFSTAFECLIGYLYVQDNISRLQEIFAIARQIAENNTASV